MAGLVGIAVLVAADDSSSGDPTGRPDERPPGRLGGDAAPAPTSTSTRPRPVTAASGEACSERAVTSNGDRVRLVLCAAPPTVKVGEEVSFEVAVEPCDGTLDFGDGATTPVRKESRYRVAHIYGSPGGYTARLTAGCGPAGDLATTVTVTPS